MQGSFGKNGVPGVALWESNNYLPDRTLRFHSAGWLEPATCFVEHRDSTIGLDAGNKRNIPHSQHSSDDRQSASDANRVLSPRGLAQKKHREGPAKKSC
jgi:hypothetical protein